MPCLAMSGCRVVQMCAWGSLTLDDLHDLWLEVIEAEGRQEAQGAQVESHDGGHTALWDGGEGQALDRTPDPQPPGAPLTWKREEA